MNTKQLERGQGLVEYGIIIALVAIITAVAIGLVSRATQRGYGVIGAALGAKRDNIGGRVIEITNAQCIVEQKTIHHQNSGTDEVIHQTGMWIIGITNVNVAELTASTEKVIGTGLDGLPSPVEVNGDPSSFKWHPTLSPDTEDSTLCPKAIVIQANDGTIALSPVNVVNMTAEETEQ